MKKLRLKEVASLRSPSRAGTQPDLSDTVDWRRGLSDFLFPCSLARLQAPEQGIGVVIVCIFSTLGKSVLLRKCCRGD